MKRINAIEETQKKETVAFSVGDTIEVQHKVVEAGKSRIQKFKGVVIKKQGSGIKASFTVRKISFGVGVEKLFPVHSPNITQVTVITRGKVRRAKLYYIREKIGKKAKIKEKRQD